ncbi:MAG TPA: hypothetical protein PKN04_01860 [bacterium]|jgi:sugar lactone lactonase YvrE|nr:hypothetical protein [bacterium]HNT64505.1 hypothetical protein [bacterium]
MQKSYWLFVFIVLGLAAPLHAVKTRKIQQSSFSSFLRGKGNEISILHGGRLTPGPQQRLSFDSGDPYIWDMTIDRRGNLYIATGNDGRIYRLTAANDSLLVFDAPELEVFAVALDGRDRLIAATSPRGKVYRVNKPGSAEIIFDPEESYIWDLVVDAQNAIYVATGDAGRIYRIDTAGKVECYFDGQNAHIRCLALDKDNRLYAGSSQPGVVYRFNAEGKPFALCDPQVSEVHDLAIADDGTVYAATLNKPIADIGEQLVRQLSQKSETANQAEEAEVALSAQSIVTQAASLSTKTNGSLWRIDPSGHGREIWAFPEDLVQCLMMTADGLLVGTGSEGKIYRINANDETDLLCRFQESPVTALAAHANRWFLGTANMGKVYELLSERSKTAVFESEPLDTGSQSRWGVFDLEGDATASQIGFHTRSGNTEQPGPGWSEWQPVQQEKSDLRVVSPAARFIQWKAEFHTADQTAAVVRKVVIAYQQINLPPRISTFIVHEPGKYYPESDKRDIPSGNTLAELQGLVYPQNLPASTPKKGARSADWIFDDPNLDPLVFDLYYQLLPDGIWTPLLSDAAASVYSWDSYLMADGRYRLKLVAKDTPENPIGQALSTEKVSEPFVVDNTGPALKEFQVQRQNQGIHLLFTMQDNWTAIEAVHYSFDAEAWKVLQPLDGLNDSKTESYRLQLTQAPGTVQNLTLRAIDAVGNITVEHQRIGKN